MKITDEDLILFARKAIDKGFYATKLPEKRYGAAVLTSKGNVFSAGQYSSFNHITSIHAEMGAILNATMNGQPEIEILALSSNKQDKVCCCGICLQFIKEHSLRTGKDIRIIYDGEQINSFYQSEITEKMW